MNISGKMTIKNITICIAAIMSVTSLTACGNTSENTSAVSQTGETSAVSETSAEEPFQRLRSLPQKRRLHHPKIRKLPTSVECSALQSKEAVRKFEEHFEYALNHYRTWHIKTRCPGKRTAGFIFLKVSWFLEYLNFFSILRSDSSSMWWWIPFRIRIFRSTRLWCVRIIHCIWKDKSPTHARRAHR